MYRVYDNKEKCWVKKGVYISPNNDLSISKKAMFGTEKLSLVSNQRYVFHRDIGLRDMNNTLIFEGDVCRIARLDTVGVIAYYPEHAAYYLFDYTNSKYYTLGIDKCKEIEIIGNVFDNDDLLPS